MFFPQARLGRMIAAPGGISVASALERATAQIEEMRDRSADLMADKVRLIEGIAAALVDGDRDDVFRASNDLLGEAGVFGWRELSEVAKSLCKLLDKPGTELASPLVRLHIQTLKALVSPELAGDAPARKAVLDGLYLISRKS
jgi:hypothetical protein